MPRKYLRGLPRRLPGVSDRDTSRQIPNSWQSRIVVGIVAVPWFCLFVACGSGSTSYVPATAPVVAGMAGDEVSEAKPAKSEFSLETEARALAWGVVEKQLKYPHDADFSWLTNCKRLNEHSFAAWGTVTAANALGARLTHDWRVVLAVNQQGQFMPMYVTIGDDEGALATDDALAAFLGQPTSTQVAAAEAAQRIESARQASFRTMSDDTGDFTVTARVVSFRNHQKHGGMVTLEKEDGSTIEVPTSRLSKDDAEWVRQEIKQRTK